MNEKSNDENCFIKDVIKEGVCNVMVQMKIMKENAI